MVDMENLPQYLDILSLMNWRVFQERRVALDILNSGFGGTLPLVLLIVSATVFLLAIFQVIPGRKHSIAILVGAGVLAGVIGLAGSYHQYSAYITFLKKEGPPPRVLTEGKGVDPKAKPGYTEALIALPLLVGTGTAAVDAAGALFLLLFGGTGGSRRSSRNWKNSGH